MKILWITFAPVGRASGLFYNRPTQSGGWVDATLNGLLPFIRSGDVSLCIATLGDAERTVTDEKTEVTYRMLPMQRFRGKRAPKEAVAKWKALIDQVRPDVIQVWGTEFTFGLDVLDAAGDIPVCFYIQGVMTSVVAHPLGDVLEKSLRRLGPIAQLKLRSLKKWHKIDKKHLQLEAEQMRRCAGILMDNQWTQAQYRQYTDRFYTVPLASNPCFSQRTWQLEGCTKHTLFTVAGGACPQKGVHNAVLAVAQLKEKYPDILLNIPGNITSRKPHFLYDSLYIRHIRKLIAEHGLEKHVRFLGSLTQEQMAQQMCQANVFVMPSCVETHSSSLREAMTVGCPSVSAAVGSVPELIRHGKNGYLYRYDEVDTLAFYIDKLFSDNDLAQRLGSAGKQAVSDMFPQEKVGEMLLEAYRQMINK